MRQAASQPLLSTPDPTIYPTEVKVGQDTLHMLILELLRPLIERWFVLLGKPTFVGADQFFYYKQFDPSKVVAPDLYVLPGVPPGHPFKSWKTWKTGIVPSLAVEVTSEDFEKDYREAVARYAELGVDELIIFDPGFAQSDERRRWQRYRKLKKRGFVRAESTNADRIRVRTLGCFLRVVGEGDKARVRLGTGPTGDDLVLTEAEAERAAKEAERTAKELERAAKEEERAAKEAERTAKEEERAAKEEERAAKELERAAKEEERAAKELERAAKELERAAKEEALRRVAELEARLAEREGKSRG